jgi:outer membrane receptor protein involved in Fe transport
MPIGKAAIWTRLLRALGLALTLLCAAPGGADELVQLAQAEPAPAEKQAESESSGPTQQSTGGVEEIVVKGADSAAATNFDVADSVTAFSAADLVALGAANIADLAAFTPNLEIVTAGATTPTFFIRGVGLNDFGANATSSVAIYQDDVPVNSQALALSTLFDMETVNVLRGPQGYGLARNASGGAIKTYARKPSGQLTGFLRGHAGNFNYQEYEGAIEAPIFEDMLSGRMAFVYSDRDGTMKNRCGHAIPFSQRVPVPTFGGLQAAQKTATDPPWSICGENPTNSMGGGVNRVSEVPTGLPKWVNDKHNWAARGTLLFEPTLDTSFTLNGHLTRRNELSRLGQSYGTNGYYCLNGNTADCGTVVGVNGGSRVLNLLGGNQGLGGGGYQPIEVKQALTSLAPCYQNGFGYQTAQGCTADINDPRFAQLDLAKRVVANELARNLDRKPWEGDFNRVGGTRNDTEGGYLKSAITLPYEIQLDLITAFDRYHRHIDLDLDFSPETLFQINTHDSGYQFYQDGKLSGEVPVNDTPVSWEVGGWVLPEKLEVNILNDLGKATSLSVGERNYTQRLLSFGGYGSFSFDFSDDFTLDGGVRWNWERKKIDYLLSEQGGLLLTPLHEHNIWSAPTGSIRLTYRFTEDTHVFLKYTRGWKPGHYNATGSRISGITHAEPESIDAYETGLAASWFGGMVGGEAQLFYYNYKNYQIFTAQQFANSGPEFVVINANDAELYGAEINAILRPPWAGGYINANFSWLESEFLDFVLLQQALVNFRGTQQVINRELQNSGNPLLNSPRFKISLTAEQAFPLGKYGYIVPRYDGSWTDDTYYDATKGRGIPNLQGQPYAPKLTFAQRAHWIHNIRAAYRTPDGRIELAGWIRNLENAAYKQYTFDGSTFQSTSIYFVGDPRTFGGDLTVTF